MSNGDDPTAVSNAIADAEDAFNGLINGQPTVEEGIDCDEDWTTQLTKACQLLDAAHVIRRHNGHYTAIIELCFGATERSVEAWLLNRTGSEPDDFDDHEHVYRRADTTGLLNGAGGDLADLWSGNRNASYYANDSPTYEQADAMVDLAESVHEYVGGEIDGPQRYCDC